MVSRKNLLYQSLFLNLIQLRIFLTIIKLKNTPIAIDRH